MHRLQSTAPTMWAALPGAVMAYILHHPVRIISAKFPIGVRVSNCMAFDAKLVSALHSAGGFAGQMKTGGAVELGTVNIA